MAAVGRSLRVPSRRRLPGFSLLELLVAVIVVAIGTLGVVRLQLHSAQNNRAALLRSEAALLAEDALERMRANPTSARYATRMGEVPPAYVDCLGKACTSDELAAFDLMAWKCALGAWHDTAPCQRARAAGLSGPVRLQPGLPAGDGAIDVLASSITVTVAWRSGGDRRLRLSGRR